MVVAHIIHKTISMSAPVVDSVAQSLTLDDLTRMGLTVFSNVSTRVESNQGQLSDLNIQKTLAVGMPVYLTQSEAQQVSRPKAIVLTSHEVCTWGVLDQAVVRRLLTALQANGIKIYIAATGRPPVPLPDTDVAFYCAIQNIPELPASQQLFDCSRAYSINSDDVVVLDVMKLRKLLCEWQLLTAPQGPIDGDPQCWVSDALSDMLKHPTVIGIDSPLLDQPGVLRSIIDSVNAIEMSLLQMDRYHDILKLNPSVMIIPVFTAQDVEQITSGVGSYPVESAAQILARVTSWATFNEVKLTGTVNQSYGVLNQYPDIKKIHGRLVISRWEDLESPYISRVTEICFDTVSISGDALMAVLKQATCLTALRLKDITLTELPSTWDIITGPIRELEVTASINNGTNEDDRFFDFFQKIVTKLKIDTLVLTKGTPDLLILGIYILMPMSLYKNINPEITIHNLKISADPGYDSEMDFMTSGLRLESILHLELDHYWIDPACFPNLRSLSVFTNQIDDITECISPLRLNALEYISDNELKCSGHPTLQSIRPSSADLFGEFPLLRELYTDNLDNIPSSPNLSYVQYFGSNLPIEHFLAASEGRVIREVGSVHRLNQSKFRGCTELINGTLTKYWCSSDDILPSSRDRFLKVTELVIDVEFPLLPKIMPDFAPELKQLILKLDCDVAPSETELSLFFSSFDNLRHIRILSPERHIPSLTGLSKTSIKNKLGIDIPVAVDLIDTPAKPGIDQWQPYQPQALRRYNVVSSFFSKNGVSIYAGYERKQLYRWFNGIFKPIDLSTKFKALTVKRAASRASIETLWKADVMHQLGKLQVVLQPKHLTIIPTLLPSDRVAAIYADTDMPFQVGTTTGQSWVIQACEQPLNFTLFYVLKTDFKNEIPKKICRQLQHAINQSNYTPNVPDWVSTFDEGIVKNIILSNCPVDQKLSKLIEYCKDFKDDAPQDVNVPGPPHLKDLIIATITQVGTCAARTRVFLFWASVLGVTCVANKNDVHEYIQFFVPNLKRWFSIDLGGGQADSYRQVNPELLDSPPVVAIKKPSAKPQYPLELSKELDESTTTNSQADSYRQVNPDELDHPPVVAIEKPSAKPQYALELNKELAESTTTNSQADSYRQVNPDELDHPPVVAIEKPITTNNSPAIVGNVNKRLGKETYFIQPKDQVPFVYRLMTSNPDRVVQYIASNDHLDRLMYGVSLDGVTNIPSATPGNLKQLLISKTPIHIVVNLDAFAGAELVKINSIFEPTPMLAGFLLAPGSFVTALVSKVASFGSDVTSRIGKPLELFDEQLPTIKTDRIEWKTDDPDRLEHYRIVLIDFNGAQSRQLLYGGIGINNNGFYNVKPVDQDPKPVALYIGKSSPPAEFLYEVMRWGQCPGQSIVLVQRDFPKRYETRINQFKRRILPLEQSEWFSVLQSEPFEIVNQDIVTQWRTGLRIADGKLIRNSRVSFSPNITIVVTEDLGIKDWYWLATHVPTEAKIRTLSANGIQVASKTNKKWIGSDIILSSNPRQTATQLDNAHWVFNPNSTPESELYTVTINFKTWHATCTDTSLLELLKIGKNPVVIRGIGVDSALFKTLSPLFLGQKHIWINSERVQIHAPVIVVLPIDDAPRLTQLESKTDDPGIGGQTPAETVRFADSDELMLLLKQRRMIHLIGPSGSGKDTVITQTNAKRYDGLTDIASFLTTDSARYQLLVLRAESVLGSEVECLESALDSGVVHFKGKQFKIDPNQKGIVIVGDWVDRFQAPGWDTRVTKGLYNPVELVMGQSSMDPLIDPHYFSKIHAAVDAFNVTPNYRVFWENIVDGAVESLSQSTRLDDLSQSLQTQNVLICPSNRPILEAVFRFIQKREIKSNLSKINPTESGYVDIPKSIGITTLAIIGLSGLGKSTAVKSVCIAMGYRLLAPTEAPSDEDLNTRKFFYQLTARSVHDIETMIELGKQFGVPVLIDESNLIAWHHYKRAVKCGTEPTPGFALLLTGNPPEGYIGRKEFPADMVNFAHCINWNTPYTQADFTHICASAFSGLVPDFVSGVINQYLAEVTKGSFPNSRPVFEAIHGAKNLSFNSMRIEEPNRRQESKIDKMRAILDRCVI